MGIIIRFIKPFARLALFALAGLSLMGMAGCATANQDESDLPWNTPQPWEGSPTIPGINDMQ